jgi:hypothetical protein
MTDTHIHVYINGEKGEAATAPPPPPKKRKPRKAAAKKKSGAGLPKKYAKMGFKKGWREYKKTAAYKRKKAKR